VHPQPRPPAAALLCARFVVSRTALVARPDGPLWAWDARAGRTVWVSLPRLGLRGERLAAAVERWNALDAAACPPVLETCVHGLRSVLVLADAAGAAAEPVEHDQLARLRRDAARLGAQLDASGIGDAGVAPPTIGVVRGAPLVRRPLLDDADPARPLAALLEAAAGEVALRPPPAAPADRPAGRRQAPRRRTTLACVAAALAGFAGASALEAVVHGAVRLRAAPTVRAAAQPRLRLAARPRGSAPHRALGGAPGTLRARP
jgi:hypothetical protein